MKLKDTPKVDRPREKFLEKGPDALTKSELLAILLGSGIKGKNVQKLSQQIIKKFGKNFLNITVDDLQKISGIGQAKALQIVSATALAKRIQDEQKPQDNVISSAKDAVALVSDLKNKKQEHLICLYLNARNVLLQKETVSIGTLDKSIVHPRDIFAPALKLHSAGVILVHNHPSGDSTPSEQDKEIAWKIIEAGKLMGINVVDMIIVAKNGIHSILSEAKKAKNLSSVEYVADGNQVSLFDLLVDERMVYDYQETSQTKERKEEDSIRMIDLFAGIGGFHQAFHEVGAQCVFASEWNEPARETYSHNFYKLSPKILSETLQE